MFDSRGRLHVHFAIPFYAGDQLIRSLREIAPGLASSGISIPDPASYRGRFARKAKGEDCGVFLPAEVISLGASLALDAELVVLSFTDLGGHPSRMFDRGLAHPGIEHSIEFLRRVFPNREMSLFFSVADPGAVTAAMLGSGVLPASRSEELARVRPLWSELVERIDAHHPDLPVTLWSTEDTPCTWPVVLRETLGLAPGTAVTGGLHMAGALLDKPSRRALSRSIKSDPPRSETDLVRRLNAFLAAHVAEERLTFDVDLPGWTRAVFEDFAEIHEQDLDACLDMEQVRLITAESVLENDMGAPQEIAKWRAAA